MTTWIVAVAFLLLLGLLALIYYMMELGPKSPKKLLSTPRNEFRMPDIRFYNSPEAFYDVLKSAGEKGRPLMRRYWLLDFGLIASFWCVMLAISLNIAGQGNISFTMMAILTTARAVFDIAEDLLFLTLLKAYPVQKQAMASTAGIMTALKSLCLYSWVAVLFVKLFSSAFGFNL